MQMTVPAHPAPLSRRFCVAPMMDWTDRHCRYFMRQLSQQALLYTEMVTTGALLHGDRERFLRFSPAELPVALQLGGSDPSALAACAQMAEEKAYSEVNLNVGCPSDRVQNGMIGACLMAEPGLVGKCLLEMQKNVSIPVTIKCRIGIDDQDSYEQLCHFVRVVEDISGVNTFIIHARKAILKGLSPKENREIPPLHYDYVYRIKEDFPALEVIINGGIREFDEIDTHLDHVDGVMLGREAYQNPFLLAEVDHRLYGAACAQADREAVIMKMLPYIREQLQQGSQLKHISRHMLGLFQGQKGAKYYRRYLSEHAHLKDADESTLISAMAAVRHHRQAPDNNPINEEAGTC